MISRCEGIPMTWSLADLMPAGDKLHILDVGAAFLENPPYQALVDAGRARISGFEPDQHEREKLQQKYGDSHVFYPYFVGSGGPATFHQTNWSITGSLFEPNTQLVQKFNYLDEVMHPVSTEPVMTVRLDDMPEIRDVDFIKIDVQGAELAVLQNATRILPEVLLIQAEVEFVPLYRDQPMFADVDTFLRASGFQFHAFDGLYGRSFKPMLPSTGPYEPFRQLLWSDALYVANWMELERLTVDKLRRYAVLAHDVLRSFDLVHLILSELDRRSGEFTADLYEMMHAEHGAASTD
jgi:FkbM family methyltransferase